MLVRAAALLICLVLPAVSWAEDPPPPSEAEMAARIDQLLATRWQEEGVRPAKPASEAGFLRRAWLDLCGVIPPLSDETKIVSIRGYMTDPDPDRRQRLVAALLGRAEHARHFTNLWSEVLLPGDPNVRQPGVRLGFEKWMRKQFARNARYDWLAAELISATGQTLRTTPALFAAAHYKPERLAAASSRVFLGTQIQCAQCHDHPHDHWTREDFWNFAAFFARVRRQPDTPQLASSLVVDATSGELRIPDTKTIAEPRYLGGELYSQDRFLSRRERLADWLTSKQNPLFAEAAVNRAWSVMFGRGLVEPVDDLGPHNPGLHPELLEELGEYFVATRFDLRRLLRTLARTRAYRLSSRSESDDPRQLELLARMPIKQLTAEQLYESLARARGGDWPDDNPQYNINRARDQFLQRFRGRPDQATEFQTGMPQALSLMNGRLVREATDISSSPRLRIVGRMAARPEERVELLFLSALSRTPTSAERKQFVDYVTRGGVRADPDAALADVFWALLNSAEFSCNH